MTIGEGAGALLARPRPGPSGLGGVGGGVAAGAVVASGAVVAAGAALTMAATGGGVTRAPPIPTAAGLACPATQAPRIVAARSATPSTAIDLFTGRW
jgi:hypothetical protein